MQIILAVFDLLRGEFPVKEFAHVARQKGNEDFLKGRVQIGEHQKCLDIIFIKVNFPLLQSHIVFYLMLKLSNSPVCRAAEEISFGLHIVFTLIHLHINPP